jgi:sulfite reductase alpha subunit-like flavoprotein
MAAATARQVLDAAAASYGRLGHENLGFLSERHGFMPREPPLLALPARYEPWDAVAAALPELYRTRSVRAALDALPLIDAVALDDRSLLRASTVLSILAHAYHRAGAADAPELPGAIAVPWEAVTRRLERPSPVLSYIDLIVYNWRPTVAGPLLVENLALLVPTVDNVEERVFYLTQVEILARATPILAAVVRAQEAVAGGDREGLADELIRIADCLHEITARALPKIDPNPLGRFAVDPVVWAKTVAPFAVPIVPGAQGPSGTSSPIFHLLYAFFGRSEHASVLGGEMVRLRAWYPRHWRELLAAVAATSVSEHVAGDRRLAALYRDALAAYAGDDGYLARHRLKVYGYLELAFKVGRTLTIGGFAGVFKDRTWDEVDGELERSRAERHSDEGAHFHELRVLAPAAADAAGTVQRVAFDTAPTGVRFGPGDRCAVLPLNRPELVGRTLRALGGRGDEVVTLDRAWRRVAGRSELPLRTLLEHGRIRPVARAVAKTLAAMAESPAVGSIVEAREEDQWELCDVLELLRDTGFDPRILWQARPADPESICRIVPPETPRHYSVASAGEGRPLELAVGLLRYASAAPGAGARERIGTASGFLADGAAPTVRVRVIPAMRFRPPDDHGRPLVMFAHGSGIAPFRAFLQARGRHDDAGETWLFLGARTRAEIPFRDELERVRRLRLRFAVSREGPEPQRIGDVIRAEAAELRRLLGPDGGYAYVCGRAGFAGSVTSALAEAVGGLPELAADGRFVREVFSTYTFPHGDAPVAVDASEIARRNDEPLWMVFDGRVYDVTEFLALHPGGTKTLRGYVGTDASAVYRSVGHAHDPGVDALRATYEIGVVRRLDLGSAWGVWVGDEGLRLIRLRDLYRRWVTAMYLAVEMENAHRNDLSIRDRATTRDEEPRTVSPFKAELLAEIRPRFVANYVAGLEEALRELWAPTSGACSPVEDVRWMERRLAAMRAGGVPSAASELAGIDAANARDAALLREIKDTLRAGVQLFERFERDVLRLAADRLLETARALADCLERWYADAPAR